MADDALPLARILALDAGGRPGIFTNENPATLSDRIFGGQLLGQALAAASRTLPDDRPAHSMHAYFVRGGIPGTELEYRVERLSDGRTLAHRQVRAMQTDRTLFSSIISFQAEEAGATHQRPAPAVPGPEEVSPVDDFVFFAAVERGGFEVRPVGGEDAAQLGGEEVGRRAFWIRLRDVGAVPDDPAFHQQAIAYASDFALMATSMKVHGFEFGQNRGPGTLLTSLDHALWWHEPARMDEWTLIVQESSRAAGGRSMTAAHFYTAEGVLVASVAQEILFRIGAAQ